MPASCPQAPDGSKRTVPKDATARNAVALYISDTEDMTYTEVTASCCALKGWWRGRLAYS